MINIPSQVSKNTTLFLDRDGVINVRIVGGYILNWDMFSFIQNVPIAIAKLSNHFGNIIIITNQQGIGKNLMTYKDIELINQNLINQIKKQGGRIDKVYFAPKLKSDDNYMRKPNIGMALEAKKDFQNIDFQNSVMVGDTVSDMQFGRNIKATNIIVGPENKEIFKNTNLADYHFDNLYDFANVF